jgi:hypothetical protein
VAFFRPCEFNGRVPGYDDLFYFGNVESLDVHPTRREYAASLLWVLDGWAFVLYLWDYGNKLAGETNLHANIAVLRIKTAFETKVSVLIQGHVRGIRTTAEAHHEPAEQVDFTKAHTVRGWHGWLGFH